MAPDDQRSYGYESGRETADTPAGQVQDIIRQEIGALLRRVDVGFLIQPLAEKVAADLMRQDPSGEIFQNRDLVWKKVQAELGRVGTFAAAATGRRLLTAPATKGQSREQTQRSPQGQPDQRPSWQELATRATDMPKDQLNRLIYDESMGSPPAVEEKLTILRAAIDRNDLHPRTLRTAHIHLIYLFKRMGRYQEALNACDELLAFQRREGADQMHIDRTNRTKSEIQAEMTRAQADARNLLRR